MSAIARIYRYSTPVAQSQHIVHMSPRAVERQRVKGHTLLIEPAPTIRTERDDVYGNRVVMFDIEQEHKELILHARSTIGVTAPRAVDLAASMPWEAVVAAIADPQARHRSGGRALCLRVQAHALDGRDRRLCAGLLSRGTPGAAGRLGSHRAHLRRLHVRCDGDRHLDAGHAGAAAAPRRVPGLLAPGARLPARHAPAGPLRQRLHPDAPAAGRAAPRRRRRLARLDLGVVAGSSAGSTSIRPTGSSPRDEHITIAYGRDYDDVSPISGILLGGSDHTVHVGVDVVPVG